METLGGKASLKRTHSGEKVVHNVPVNTNTLKPEQNSSQNPSITLTLGRAEQGQKVGSQDKGKALLDPEPSIDESTPEITPKKSEPEPSFNVFLHQQEDETGESCHPVPPPQETSSLLRRPIACKFCGQEFSTTQALGGHQNAHKQEREMQKAMKAAQVFGNPFMYHLPRSPLFRGSYYGFQFPQPSYQGYGHVGWQPRAFYPSPRLTTGHAQGSANFARALEQVVGRTAINLLDTSQRPSGWTRPPYIHPSGFVQSPNFSLTVASNATTSQQIESIEASPAKKQRIESVGLELSLNCSDSAGPSHSKTPEPTVVEVPSDDSDDSELDLTLKL